MPSNAPLTRHKPLYFASISNLLCNGGHNAPSYPCSCGIVIILVTNMNIAVHLIGECQAQLMCKVNDSQDFTCHLARRCPT